MKALNSKSQGCGFKSWFGQQPCLPLLTVRVRYKKGKKAPPPPSPPTPRPLCAIETVAIGKRPYTNLNISPKIRLGSMILSQLAFPEKVTQICAMEKSLPLWNNKVYRIPFVLNRCTYDCTLCFVCTLNMQEDGLQGEVLASITVINSPFFSFNSSFTYYGYNSWGCTVPPPQEGT